MKWNARALYSLLTSGRGGLRDKKQQSKHVSRSGKKSSMRRAQKIHEVPGQPTITEIEGVPVPPPSIHFMKKSLDDALLQSVKGVKLVAASGGNVRDGLLLDIGCGYGRFAYGLLKSGFKGRYVGVDIVEPRVAWLKENFTPRQPRYTFHFVDVENSHYNPAGEQKQASYRDILGGESADTIALFSVFTHMYKEDIEAHLVKIAEVMSPSTKLLFSCFLFDGIAEEGLKAGKAHRQFRYELSPDCRYDRIQEPLRAIAFREHVIHRALEQAGLTGEVVRGGWSGALERPPAGHQDWVIAAKA